MRRLLLSLICVATLALPVSTAVPDAAPAHSGPNGLVEDSQRLVAVDAAAGYMFGADVAVSGDLAVVGAPNTTNGGVAAGAAYVFTRTAGTWYAAQKLLNATNPAVNDWFGMSVATDGQTIVVGAPGRNGEAGEVFVYVYDTDQWVLQAQLTASDTTGGWRFGRGVAVDGDLIVAGSPFADAGGKDEVGAAYVFTRTGTTWTEQQKVSPSAADAGDYFGNVVRVSGDTFISGSGHHDVAGNADQGQVWIYAPVGGVWQEQGALIADDGGAGHRFGGALAISGDTAVVGAHDAGNGKVYVFTRAGTSWQAPTILLPGEETTDFGWNVAVRGGTIAVATSNDTFVYAWDGSAWNRTSWLRTRNEDFPLGHGLAITGGAVLGSSQTWSGMRGAVFVFKVGLSVTSVAPASGPASGGTSVTITGSNFPDDASVEFGGEPATNVTRESDTTLTATTPAHGAGVVDVAVSGGGGSAVLADAFTYVAPPAISSIAPGFGPTAGGTTITITGTGFTDTPAVHIGSLPATTITFVSDTTLTAVTPAHAAGPVDILLTNPDGQMVTETEGFVFGDADLTILNVPGLPKAGAGFDYAVAAKVKNLGPGPAPTSQVFFYLSTDSALNNGLEDRYLGSVAVPALAKNQVYRAARTVTIPPDTDAGSYYLLATADGLGDLAEAREDNNVRAKALTVGCNLLVPVLIAPRAADPGETIRITEVTKNSGPAAAPATQTELVLSTNTTLGDGDDIWLRARAIGSLNPLQSSKLVEMRTLPGGLPPGTYYLIARADREGTARETSEADNIKVRAITIR